ncbi:SDR family oxidoreductase [Vibrio hepatarius]|uniref:SDR family oxidoreductase n=1 Tax=Vibrio hepatarius TaxID=171383 RepID=UPI00142D3342|nr:SDR family oxidoreductase [Vibrio hepatarius]NIY82210.1 SDR family oxidoreductase [Vibrio hepatarius]NVJ58562.1 SDR family oxidoreductase [Vibrionaceae bacterium]
MNITNSVVLITSAGSQLGSTLAYHFATLGATIVLCDKESSQFNDTYKLCHEVSSHIHKFPINDHSIESVSALFEYIDHELHRSPDVLINAITVEAMPNIFDHAASDAFTQSLALMAATLFTFGQATAERMREEKKNGVIVNVISHNDYQDLSGLDNATSMVAGFTQSWAKQLTPFNIRVGGVVPGVEKNSLHWAEIRDELIRNTEYIVSNDYFSGRVMAA